MLTEKEKTIVKRMAFDRYQKRTRIGKEGTDISDWLEAEDDFKKNYRK